MFVSAKIAPRKELYVQKDAKAVDLTPWKYAKPVSGIVVTTLIYIYTVLLIKERQFLLFSLV